MNTQEEIDRAAEARLRHYAANSVRTAEAFASIGFKFLSWAGLIALIGLFLLLAFDFLIYYPVVLLSGTPGYDVGGWLVNGVVLVPVTACVVWVVRDWGR